MTAEIALIALVVAGGIAWFLLAMANRLDLLHQKVARTSATLDTQLVRRAGLAAELAASGILDPAASLALAQAAADCLAADAGEIDPHALAPALDDARGLEESDLTRVLRQALDGAVIADQPIVVQDVMVAWRRAGLARRFYNDAVAQARRMRSHGYVRAFRLAGRSSLPRTFEMDDALPR